jgi:hypothetical protein
MRLNEVLSTYRENPKWYSHCILKCDQAQKNSTRKPKENVSSESEISVIRSHRCKPLVSLIME